jgi:hypothetical protein
MNKPWKVVLAFAAVFAAGSIFGGLLMMRVGQRMVEKRRAQLPPPNPPMVLRHFSEQLDLTAAQKEKIRPLVEKAEEEMRALRQKSLKETGVVLRRLQQEFAAEVGFLLIRECAKVVGCVAGGNGQVEGFGDGDVVSGSKKRERGVSGEQ